MPPSPSKAPHRAVAPTQATPPHASASDLRTSDLRTSDRLKIRSFLDGLELQFGPIRLFGNFLLEADGYLRRHGISLSFDNINSITSTHARNQETWGRFAPQLDTNIVSLSNSESYCMVGRSSLGQTVAVQGGRIYDTGTRSLADIAADRSIYYGRETPPAGGFSCTLTAPSADIISDRYVYSGGLWVHPNFRGAKLAGLLPRMSRVYAMSLWNTQFTYAFIGEKMARSPLLGLYGYTSVEADYLVFEDGKLFYNGHLMWMDQATLVDDITNFMSSGFFETNGHVGHGARDDVHRAAG